MLDGRVLKVGVDLGGRSCSFVIGGLGRKF